MLGIGMPELIIIVVIALFVIRPTDIPRIAREAGGFLRGLRNTADDLKREIEQDIQKTDTDPEKKER
jgi:sec-independent protein translocase protein TatA